MSLLKMRGRSKLNKTVLVLQLVLFGLNPLVMVGPAMAQYRGTVNGGTVDNSGQIPFDQAFFAFEVESPIESLTGVPIWDETEQMLDNPYQFALELAIDAGLAPPFRNFQGFPPYRLTQPRRRSFHYRNAAGEPCAPLSAGCAEVPLDRHIIHPLNYNPQSGEELRLLNIDFDGANWDVANPCYDPTPTAEQVAAGVPPWLAGTWTCGQVTLPDGRIQFTFNYDTIAVSPGIDRLDSDEPVIDYNSPIKPQTEFCVESTVEPIPPPEGSRVCGHDTGEPGYAGFGVLLNGAARRAQYSVPAVPGGTQTGDFDNGPKSSVVGLQLFDPSRGFINARAAAAPVGGLRRPSLRAEGQLTQGGGRIHNGNPSNPDYLINSAANLAADPAALLPSNENDYYRGASRAAKVTARNQAAALGKAVFWDMQIGSDSVQSCASCHFHAGVDNRTKGQINSGINAGDTTTITVAGLVNGTASGQNAEVTVDSFPLHKLADPFTPSDPMNLNGNTIVRTTNDVVSSMGVSRYKLFGDVPVGTAAFLPAAAGGVASLRMDYACGDPTAPAPINTCVPPSDPVTINQGFRRVEPRHTPTFFAATLNFDNFWDGRARHDYNGGSVFGPADPQSHVMVHDPVTGELAATRQIIRFSSLASLSQGPALSEFEMSFAGRNWAKLGKRMLQPGVTPLANQLVDTTDSVLGPYSNQGGSACAALPAADRSPGTTAAGKPGLCINYAGLIRRAFYDNLWINASQHLNGCYTDGNAALHPNQCAADTVHIDQLVGGAVTDTAVDPFDNYVLSVAPGAATALDTNQFTQMEANFSLFFGLGLQAWGHLLIPDDTPYDRFMDANPEAFETFGEAGENALVLDLATCGQTFPPNTLPLVQGTACFTEVGNFKRDNGNWAKLDCPGPEGTTNCKHVEATGTRVAGSVDPLLGLDFFLGSNMSLKNPGYNSLRCGECHAGATLTDHTVGISHQLGLNDWVQEFFPLQPGRGIFPEPLGRGRLIAGFALEGEINGTAQDAVERNIADFCTITPCEDVYGNPIPGGLLGSFPQAQALFDNGVYNIGVTPIGDDISRGGNDAFGWPLSLSRLALKNLCGVDYTPGGDNVATGFAQPAGGGNPCPTFDPTVDPIGGGLFEPTGHDQGINPGFEEEPADPQLPAYLAPWASNLNVGDEVQVDELFVGLNTTMREPILEGFIDSFGPFDPATVLGESMNNSIGDAMATWPNMNRVNAQGAFKAAPLRNVELTNPYFHDGGNLTLRQQLDFYTRGGNFPLTNKAHRDFLIMNLKADDEALGAIVVPQLDPNLPNYCDVSQPLGSRGRADCPHATPINTAGTVPLFSEAQKEEIIVAVVDFLLELTDERVKFERAPFDHPELFVPLDATAPENGVLATVAGNRAGLLANTVGVCADSAGVAFPGATTSCFRQVPAVGQGGNAAALPNFLNIASGPRLVGGAAFCGTVDNHYCH